MANSTVVKIINGSKKCSQCKNNLPISNFHKNKVLKCGLQSACKKCISSSMKLYYSKKDTRSLTHRKPHLKKMYNLEIDEYLKMFEIQNNLCAICGKAETAVNVKGNTRALSVDHDHKTGKVRSLLCHSCNQGLGYFKDNPELLQRSIEYLTNHK